MRKWILGGIGVLLAGGVAAMFATGMISIGANSGVCMQDSEIAPDERKGIEDTALAMVGAMIAGKDADAYAFMTPDAQGAVPKAQFAQFVRGTNATMGPFRDALVTRTYLVASAGSGPNARAVCGLVSGDRWVSLEIKPGVRQAHVVVAAQSRNNSWEYTVWLLPMGKSWRAQYVNLNASAIVGHSADDLLAMARRERDVGHGLNAAVLFAAARGLADRGPSFQLGVVQTLNEEAAQFPPPPELEGQPPFVWTLNGRKFAVTQVNLMGVDHKLVLVFNLPRKDWPGDAAVDAQNREFLDAFRAAHPEYAGVFPFLLARAMKPDNSGGFGTVYDNVKGYKR